ncbi:MAG TPA: ABC transporter ATP-binding protein [Bryobacteraceae bacterium]|jgi:ATP-binding cassette subfamily B protein|nr:ABC transporter ATP-binding protein [Bryobacteraceae bacterium]
MHSSWQAQSKAWRDRIRALKNIPPVLKLLWQSGPVLVTSGLFFRIVIALLPLGALAVGRLIINLIVDTVKSHAPISSEIWYLLGAEFLIAITGAILGRAVDYCDGRIADEFAREVSVRVMNHAATLDLASFEDPIFYDKLERARLQANHRVGMLSALGNLVQQSVTLLSLSISVMWFSPLLFALLVLTVVPAFLGESHFAFLGYSLAYSLTPLRRELDYIRDLGTKKEGAKELKVFGLGAFLSDRFSAINDEVIERNRKLASRRLRAGALLSLVGSLGYYAAYAIVVLQTVSGKLSIGDLTFLAGALAGCSTQIQMVFSTFTSIADQALFLSDLLEFFATGPAIRNSAQPLVAPRKITDGFDFQDVSFTYPGSRRAVLHDFNFRIHSGERIAVVGENGQGKTTLVKLISRLYDPTAGRILLDGVDLRDYDIDSLHSKIGVIFQDFMRYDLTARENIAMGRIDLLEDEPSIMHAARKSGASTLLDRLPDGLDQILGRRFEGGVDLSGGEWQKIAIARAYMRDADILILDEPTAALDAKAEYEVFSRFAELTEGKIAVLISHRFSTVRMSDRIVVLEAGAIREEGSHSQLMARGGKYAGMFELQASSYR